ncbi:MAG TPA: endonuclease/exonuclease/phosphatase family protein, partial [Cytophagales bacterium]
IALVDRFVRESPHKVILCGDFNDIPYSYTYQRMRRQLRNAFEDAGSGFGFTLNDDKLFFLRIDNQFYDKALNVHDFQTHRDVTYSDHFPISATYSFR